MEDIREACTILKDLGYDVERITHCELMSSANDYYLRKLSTYNLLWISTPTDWYIRSPNNRTQAHWQRLRNWMTKACDLQITFIMFGPPGFPWKIPNIKESIEDLQLNISRMRLCHFQEKADKNNPLPSGTYLQAATNMNISRYMWKCPCAQSIPEHVLDWYGHTQEHSDWRRKVSRRLIK